MSRIGWFNKSIPKHKSTLGTNKWRREEFHGGAKEEVRDIAVRKLFTLLR